MDQTHDNSLSQGSYLERMLEQQYQQIFQQRQGDRNGSEMINNSAETHFINNESLSIGLPPTSLSYPSGNNSNNSPATTTSNTMGIAINHQHQHQQNRMMTLLQERQQQHLMTNSIIGESTDFSSNLGISGLSANVGLDSRACNSNGIGSSVSSNVWVDGLSSGAYGTGTISSSGSSFYSTEQDFLLSSHRLPSLTNSMVGNRTQANARSNGTFGDGSLASVLGGLPRFCLPTGQASFHSHQKSPRKSFTDVLLAKQAQAALLQAAQARAPRTIRLPCGARGMKADHNSSTAYFDVPENARHGQHLLCSHSVCRSAGVKFRYCFYCRKPVTKQNFRSRHLHANLDPNNKNKDEKEVDKKKKQNQVKSGKREKATSKEGRSSAPTGAVARNRSVQNYNTVVLNDNEKDPVESLSDLPVDNGSERPSKTRKFNLEGEWSFQSWSLSSCVIFIKRPRSFSCTGI